MRDLEKITMKPTMAFLAAIAVVFASVCSAYGVWSVSNEGQWPKTWPKELEPLRKQAHTRVGGVLNLTVHNIHFTKREEFESAWPHLLKVKSKGAPVILVRSPNNWLGSNAGVSIHMAAQTNGKVPEAPILEITNTRERWLYTTFIELVVDGQVVDLNRLPLPADAPIVDERFEDSKSK